MFSSFGKACQKNQATISPSPRHSPSGPVSSLLCHVTLSLGDLATTGEKGRASGIEQKHHQVSERFGSGEDGAWLLAVRDGQVADWQCWAMTSMRDLSSQPGAEPTVPAGEA